LSSLCVCGSLSDPKEFGAKLVSFANRNDSSAAGHKAKVLKLPAHDSAGGEYRLAANLLHMY